MNYKKTVELLQSLNIILKKSLNDSITIGIMMFTDEWNEKSDEILRRDNFCCQKCHARWNPYSFEGNNVNNINYNKVEDRWLTKEEFNEWSIKMKNFPKSTVKVYHKLYKANTLPWEYYDSDLISLCNSCSKEEPNIHDLYKNNEKIKVSNTCEKCYGKGHISEYNHIEKGICYDCKGTGLNNKI